MPPRLACAHMELSPEAYAVTDRGEERIVVILCGWAEAMPERFLDAPRWLSKQVVSGTAVVPEFDCLGCPAFKPRKETP